MREYICLDLLCLYSWTNCCASFNTADYKAVNLYFIPNLLNSLMNLI